MRAGKLLARCCGPPVGLGRTVCAGSQWDHRDSWRTAAAGVVRAGRLRWVGWRRFLYG